MKYTALATLALTLSTHAFASDTVPTLSGNYLLSGTDACVSGSVWSHVQEVETATFYPQTAKVVFKNDAENTANEAFPIQFQRTDDKDPGTFQIVGLHDLKINGQDWYVQFGGVKKGIATSAAMLSSNSQKSCAFQVTITRFNSP